MSPLLAQRNFAALWWGQLISILGERFTYLALVGLLAEHTHQFQDPRSSLLLTLLANLMLAPVLLLSPFTGAWVDRWNLKHVLVISDLLRSGLVHQPVDWLLFSPFSVGVGLISSYMPFMIYPIWLALSGIDRRLLEASWLLGARPLRTFLQVTLPLSMPGVFAGLMFAFVGSFGDSATARILGGSGFQMMGDTITSSLGVLNYPLAAATSTTVVAMMLVLLLIWFLLFDASSLLGKVATWRRQV